MRKRLNNVDAIIASNNRLGLVYTQFGAYENVLFHCKDALESKGKIKIELAKCLNNVSKAYYNLEIGNSATLFKSKAT
jgi:hypothetical protein